MPEDSAPTSPPEGGGDRRAVPMDDKRRAEGTDLRAVPIEDVRRAKGEAVVAVQRAKVSGTKAFRRTRTDRVWGAVGVVLCLVGAWMVFNWVPPVEVAPSVGVEWPEETFTRENETLTVPRGQPSLVYPIQVDEANITRMVVTVSWVDNVGDAPIEWDIVQLNLTGPEASGIRLTAQTRGDNVVGATVVLGERVSPKPDTRSVPASDLEEAGRLLGDQSNRTGTGEWRLEIFLNRVGDDFATNNARAAFDDQCPQQGVPSACTYDDGQAFQVAVEYTAYHHEFRQR